MTVPSERTRAVQHARIFLLDLLRKDVTPRVPKEIRERARQVLRHFPGDFYLEIAHEKCPRDWGETSDMGDYGVWTKTKK